MTVPAPLIEFRNISKFFGAKKANEQVSFSVRAGTIHAVVGENGAGKSTIMKMLFGLYEPDHGQILIRNQVVDVKSPAVAKSLGIGMVHQHFMLAGPLTALDHVILEMKPELLKSGLFAPLHRQQIQQELQKLAETLQMPVNWGAAIDELPVGIQQRIEILKLLFNNSDILILDEPTAVLTPQETEEFLARLKTIRSQGKTILLITHKLKEVFAVADDITVFRKGKVVNSRLASTWDSKSLAEDMIGEPFHELNVEPSSFKGMTTTPALKFESPKISFSIKKGEILGIAGVEGNGQAQIIQMVMNPLSNVASAQQTQVAVDGVLVSNMSNRQIREAGVSYLPEDRHAKGSSLEVSLLQNFLLGQQSRFQKWGLVDFKNLRRVFKKSCLEFDVQFQSETQHLSELSGGNQQKLVVARELSRPLKFLLAAHPTRGVDILAIKKIHQSFLDVRDQGTGVLLISSELEELMKLSDRIIVLYNNQVIKEFARNEFNEKTIGLSMGGLKT